MPGGVGGGSRKASPYPDRRRRRQQADAGEAAIAKLDEHHLLILDDFCFARKDQAETGVLFELIAARYEPRVAEPTAPTAENVSPATTSAISRVSVELRTGVTTNDATRQRF